MTELPDAGDLPGKIIKDGKKIKVKTIRVVSGSRIKEGILSEATIKNLQSIT
jgi:hypothetical protein